MINVLWEGFVKTRERSEYNKIRARKNLILYSIINAIYRLKARKRVGQKNNTVPSNTVYSTDFDENISETVLRDT